MFHVGLAGASGGGFLKTKIKGVVNRADVSPAAFDNLAKQEGLR